MDSAAFCYYKPSTSIRLRSLDLAAVALFLAKRRYFLRSSGSEISRQFGYSRYRFTNGYLDSAICADPWLTKGAFPLVLLTAALGYKLL